MNKQTVYEVHSRWMIRRDLPEVLRIEGACFEHSWDEADFLRNLRQRNVIGMVAEKNGEVVGYAIYETHDKFIRLLNFAVHPDCKRRGVGRQMIEKMKSKLTGLKRSALVAEVRESNLPAQMFFRSQGFQAVRVERQFYEDSGEDAYVFRFSIAEESEITFHQPTNRISKYFEETT